MTTTAFLAHLFNRGIRLWIEDQQLRYRAPQGVMTAELRKELAERKAEIMSVLRQIKASGAAMPPLVPFPRDQALPLSLAQQRLWVLTQLQPYSSFYNVTSAVRLRGPLNSATLARSFDILSERHEILRTTYAIAAGQPLQMINDRPAVRLAIATLDPLPAAAQAAAIHQHGTTFAQQPFDLEHGPLWRIQVLQLAQSDHVLLMSFHHSLVDAWSMHILLEDVIAIYAALAARQPLALPTPALHYADYAAWQRTWLQGAELEAQLGYWRAELAGAPQTLNLPTNHQRPPAQRFNGAMQTFDLPAPLAAALRQLSLEHGTTLYTTLLAAFAALLQRYTGQEDMLIGTDIANRSLPETQRIPGFFVNTLALRLQPTRNLAFRDLLAQAQRMMLGAQAHQEVPFDLVVAAVQNAPDLSRNPLFQVMFAMQPEFAELPRMPGLSVEWIELPHTTAHFDLTLVMRETGQGLAGDIEYNTDLFGPETVARLTACYGELLASIADDPAQTISQLRVLAPAEEQALIRLGAAPDQQPPELLMHRVIEGHARRHPDAIALTAGARQLTYGQLDAQANQLAHWLQAQGCGPQDRVGVFGARDIEMPLLLLATAKAGCTYVPLEPRYPDGRLRAILADSGLSLIATQTALLERARSLVAGLASPPLLYCWDAAPLTADTPGPDSVRSYPTSPLATNPAPNDIANIFYTSGSTGVPKGAMVEQIGMLNHLQAKIAILAIDESSSVVQNASCGFDISIWQFLAALVAGGKTIIYDDETALDPRALLRAVDRDQVTILETVPSMLAVMLETCAPDIAAGTLTLPRLRYVISNAETLPVPLARRWLESFPHVPLLNTYGATECSDDVTHYVMTERPPHELARILVGRPIAGFSVHIVDAALRLVPQGCLSQIALAGVGVGQGYVDDPVKTAQVFVPNPFSGPPGNRMYLTGDIGRWTADGILDFIGRADGQVKVRGQRVELGEIESVLRRHPAIQEALVLATGDHTQEARLVAYAVPQRSAARDSMADPTADALPQQWQAIFDEVYRRQTWSAHDPALNLAVWTSSYTQQPMAEAEIFACLASSVERILALRPQHILEIGCGTGLLLQRLAPHCQSYCGTDISAEALAALQRQLDQDATLAGMVHLFQRGADDVTNLPRALFDLVIINEVVQYFPSIEYTLRVLEQAVGLVRPGGAVFIGDIRNLALLEAFHCSVLRFQSPGDLPLADFREGLRTRVSREKELLLDPDFFLALKDVDPRITQVAIQLKGGAPHNELTRFRYDAVLHVAGEPAGARPTQCLSWDRDKLSLARVRQLLETTRPLALAITDIPNARLLDDICFMETLAAGEERGTLAEIERAAGACRQSATAIDPVEFWALGESLPYAVEVCWLEPSADGAYQVVFSHHDLAGQGGARPLPRARVQRQRWADYANQPAVELDLRTALRAYVREQLPEYMVPERFVLLDAMPLNANGKVDRKRLPAAEAEPAPPAAEHVAPRNPVEAQLAALFEAALGVRPISVNANFFALGGHSILAIRLLAQVREQHGRDVSLTTFFQHPTVAEVARALQFSASAEPALPLVALQPQGTQRALFFAHPGSGGVVCYAELARRLGPDQPFYGFQAPGFDGADAPLNSIQALATHYITAMRVLQPAGPYRLGGWSMGGLIAFEMARQLTQQGAEVELLALLDTVAPKPGNYPHQEDAVLLDGMLQELVLPAAGRPGAQAPALVGQAQLRAMSRDAQLHYALAVLHQVGDGFASFTIQDVERYATLFQRHVQAVETYHPQPYGGQITLLRATELSPTLRQLAAEVPDLHDPALGWTPLSRHSIVVCAVPGTHETMVKDSLDGVVQALGAQLAPAGELPAKA